MMTFDDYIQTVRARLMPPEGITEKPKGFMLRCPRLGCDDSAHFAFSTVNGSGQCQSEPLPNAGGYRRFSRWQIADLLGLDVYGVYGNLTESEYVSVQAGNTTLRGSLRGLRVESTDVEILAMVLLQDPLLMRRFLLLADSFGIVGEADLLRTEMMVMMSRKVVNYRLHASSGGETGAGKSDTTNFGLETLPPEDVLHLGGGASSRSLQYADSLEGTVIFIDEAENLSPEFRAFLREAMTRDQVTRMVTQGDPGTGFTGQKVTVNTAGMVLIQAGTHVIANPADHTRMLMLAPDASAEQTARILNTQAERAASSRPAIDFELEVWRRAQTLLRRCHVTIPFASTLSKFFPNEIRSRRDFPRLLALVAAHTCLHQFQRSCYEEDGRQMVVAEVDDYRAVHEFAAGALSQTTKRLTPTQEQIADKLNAHFGKVNRFLTQQAAEVVGKHYNTARDHLDNLMELGIVERERDRGKIFWRMVSDAPMGLKLPEPSLVVDALSDRKPRKRTGSGFVDG